MMHCLYLLCFPVALFAQGIHKTATSKWVYADKSNRLVYRQTERGDRIMDFSFAGYEGGGIAIPWVPVKKTIAPVEGDNTLAIQNAVDEVAQLPLVNGFRGAVLLAPGRYECEGTININASGVILRGSGNGEMGTVISMTGKPHNCVSVKGAVRVGVMGDPVPIADGYVPSGAFTFSLVNASRFAVGDTIRISKPVTADWVHFMGMDSLVRDGKKQTWINGEITTDRMIRAIDNNKITVDVPLTDSYDARLLAPGVTVTKITETGWLSHIGIENFRIVSPAQSVTIEEGHHRAFSMSGITDGWARNIDIINTVNSVSITGTRITADHISILHAVPTAGAAKPADFNGSGTQLLFNECHISGDNLFFFGTGAKVTGPVVVLNCVFEGNGWIQPHQRWATGLLIDNCRVPEGGIDFMNRGIYGSGHGWTIGWAVAWNCVAKTFLNQRPPGAINWVIGSTGDLTQMPMPSTKEPLLPQGEIDAHNHPVTPKSLYLAQLEERLGKKAVENTGYKNSSPSSSTRN